MNQGLIKVLLVAAVIIEASCRPESHDDIKVVGTDDQIHTREPNGDCCVIHRCCSKPKTHHDHNGSSTSEDLNDSEKTERQASNGGLSDESSSQGNANQNNYSDDQLSVTGSKGHSQARRNHSSCCGNSNRCCSRRRNKNKKHRNHHRPSTKAPNRTEDAESAEGGAGSNGLSHESSSQENINQNSNSNGQPSQTVVSRVNSQTRRSYSPCCGNCCCSRRDKHKRNREHHRPSTKAPNSTGEPADPVQDVITQDSPNVSRSRSNNSQNTNSDSQPSAGSVVPKNGSQDISNHQNSESNLGSQVAGTDKDVDHSSQISSDNQSSSGFSAVNQKFMNVRNQETFSNHSASELAGK